MATDHDALTTEVDRALKAGKPAEAICYLAQIVEEHPNDRHARLALAVALGDAGNGQGALKIIQALADRLAHDGYLLPAMVVVRHGLQHAGDDQRLVGILRRIHVRGVRAKAGNLPMPPPLKPKKGALSQATAAELLALPLAARLEKVAALGADLPAAGEAAIPLPMPLFGELEEDAFLETVKHLHYRRVAAGTKLLEEGKVGNTLLVLAAGHAVVSKGGTELAKLGPGSVLGEMAIITGAPRSATATADGEVEYFELARADVAELAQKKPKIAEELLEYCRKRLIGNLLRTSPLFARFDETTRYLLLDRFQRRGYGPGQKVIEQGKPGTGLFVIASGEVEISVAKEGGEAVVVANLGPGEVVGEIALLQDTPTTANVIARGQVGALFLPRADFQKVLEENPKAKEYLQTLSADRLKASAAAKDESEVLDADELIVL
ncbi:MAG: cyclic nucleotide-binding domain-containing protein [Deltaproteobacteria bacterium]|nr:cyclic nucleotide-binding domain-containing protein [Deltaproteobacteria bacterium]